MSVIYEVEASALNSNQLPIISAGDSIKTYVILNEEYSLDKDLVIATETCIAQGRHRRHVLDPGERLLLRQPTENFHGAYLVRPPAEELVDLNKEPTCLLIYETTLSQEQEVIDLLPPETIDADTSIAVGIPLRRPNTNEYGLIVEKVYLYDPEDGDIESKSKPPELSLV